MTTKTPCIGYCSAHDRLFNCETLRGGGHVHRDGYCYEAGMRFNEADCQGGGRETGPTAKAPEAGARPTRTNAVDSAANPVAEANASVTRYVRRLEERNRELEAELSAFHAVVASPDEAMEIVTRAEEAEARVKELEGVYEAEACPSCGKTQVDIWKIHQSVHDPPELRGEGGPDPDEKECLG